MDEPPPVHILHQGSITEVCHPWQEIVQLIIDNFSISMVSYICLY